MNKTILLISFFVLIGTGALASQGTMSTGGTCSTGYSLYTIDQAVSQGKKTPSHDAAWFRKQVDINGDGYVCGSDKSMSKDGSTTWVDNKVADKTDSKYENKPTPQETKPAPQESKPAPEESRPAPQG